MNSPSTQVFGFPVKGVNKTFARSNQPQQTAYDMLNVLPYDRTGRLRGGKRSGTVKLWSDAIGSDTDSVLLLDQVTLVTAPASATDAVVAFSADFNGYSDGDLTTESGGLWKVYDASDTEVPNVANVDSHGVTVLTDGATLQLPLCTPAFTPTDIDLAAGYTLETTVTLSAAAAQISGLYVYLETDHTNQIAGTYGFYALAAINAGAVNIGYGTPSDSFTGSPTPTLTPGVAFVLKVVVSAGTGARSATVYIDDVAVGSCTIQVPGDAVSQNFVIVPFVGTDSGSYSRFDTVVYQNPGVDSNGLSTRVTKIIAVANRDIYMGDINTQGTLATGGTDVIKKSVFPEGCYSAGKYFLVDGENITQVDIATSTVETYGTGGSIQGTPPIGTVCCIWRDRLMIAGPDQNFYGSRVGDHFDWDYSQEDSAAAFVGNDSVAGHIGEPIVALIPLGDDVLAIGGDHDLHVFSGDPAAGGNIDLVSEAVGILGPRSWCKSPEGTVYFLGTGGLYKWEGEAKPVNIADMKWSQVFAALDRSRTVASLTWNRDKQGMNIYLYKTGKTIVDAPIHLWYDRRLDALFPVQYPVGHGPTAVLVYDGDGPDDRVTLLGGRDGYVRRESDAATSDDGDAINAFLKFGPFPIGDPNNDGIISRVQITAGEPPTGFTTSDLSMVVTVRAGLTAYDVTDRGDDSKLRVSKRTYAGQQGHLIPMRQRAKGAYGMIEISDNSDDKIFSFEQMTVDMVLAGFTRH